MAKNRRFTWNYGWAESVRFDTIKDGENAIRKTRNFNWIMDIKLRSGDIFGVDDESPFVIKVADEHGCVIASARGGRGIYAQILMYRLDTNRGWCPVWECSLTTTMLMKFYKSIRHKSPVYEDNRAHRNPLCETKGTKYFVVLS